MLISRCYLNQPMTTSSDFADITLKKPILADVVVMS